MKKDMKVASQRKMQSLKEDDAFIARPASGPYLRFGKRKAKEYQEANSSVTNKAASNPFCKSLPAPVGVTKIGIMELE